jgi:hypothetical protein
LLRDIHDRIPRGRAEVVWRKPQRLFLDSRVVAFEDGVY